ncbi:ImmA/IrrE family metallo-endopeptidase [Hansschlegelia quercus]|uniref:ImmA/IrrE family metallo-endopeptidase n=1 Tax=Hansschlegelia quercus TaxID=2528245 RepID=A0A4Q9GJZ1_9HYPH|nr:ImmA/IrrE family metallo-endopeptidase [Hansschlegelia quercus]TBN54468.1 ImmA/IrrE family metallo-endopeptidase [Hansschlegelia quercus]
MRNASEVDDVVERVRKKLGIYNQEKFDIIEILSTKLKGHIAGFTLQVWADHYFTDEEAWFDSEGPKIVVKQSVYDGAALGNQRDVFTLTHELGHLILGHRGVRFRKTERDRQAQHDRITGDEEHEARLFAAAFIAPTAMLYPGITVAEIRNRFILSETAAQKRLNEYNQYWRRKNKMERPLPQNVIDFLAEFEKRR